MTATRPNVLVIMYDQINPAALGCYGNEAVKSPNIDRLAADGILDDETYDWLPVVEAMASSGGSPVVATEAQVLEANELGCRTTGIDASHTGTAGLAGLLAIRDRITPDERVVVVFSGVRR